MSVASSKAPFIEYTTTARSAQASAGVAILFQKVLPEGKWLITGGVNLGATAGTLPTFSIYTDVRTLTSNSSATGPASTILPLSFLYKSDGATALTIRATATTSASTWFSNSTIVDCDKLV
jgi:hypothetical protein